MQAHISALESEKNTEVRRLTSELENASLRATLVQQQHQQLEDRAAALKEQADDSSKEVELLRNARGEVLEQHRTQLAHVQQVPSYCYISSVLMLLHI